MSTIHFAIDIITFDDAAYVYNMNEGGHLEGCSDDVNTDKEEPSWPYVPDCSHKGWGLAQLDSLELMNWRPSSTPGDREIWP